MLTTNAVVPVGLLAAQKPSPGAPRSCWRCSRSWAATAWPAAHGSSQASLGRLPLVMGWCAWPTRVPAPAPLERAWRRRWLPPAQPPTPLPGEACLGGVLGRVPPAQSRSRPAPAAEAAAGRPAGRAQDSRSQRSGCCWRSCGRPPPRPGSERASCRAQAAAGRERSRCGCLLP